jgi:hypothetical protein
MRTTVFAATVLVAVAASARPAPPAAPSALERLRALEGEWSGPATWEAAGKPGQVEFSVRYRTTSGGHAVEETMMPGTPGEMVSMYVVEADTVVLTHYCNSGRHPRMTREASNDPDAFVFRCRGGTFDEAESHMHTARLRIAAPDRLEGSWSSVKAGQVEWVATATLTRKR